jgi:hypothetical protein
VIDQMRIDRRKPLLVAALAALAMSILLLLSAPGSARASQANFCWGVTLTNPIGNPDSSCTDSANRYSFGVYAQGTQGPVCIWDYPPGDTHTVSLLCSSNQPTYGIYHNGFDSAYSTKAVIHNNCFCRNTVYGVAYYDDNPFSWHVENIGGNNRSDPDISTRGYGTLDVFVKGSDNALWTRHMEDRGWGSWSSLGGVLTSGPGAVQQGSVTDVVARGSDNAMWHWYNAGGSWSCCQSLGGNNTSDGDVSSWGQNRLDMFVRGSDNALWHRYWNGVSWSGWESLGGSITSGPGAVSWGSNRIDVVYRTGDGRTLNHRWYDGTWHCCNNLGGVNTSDPDLASSGPGRLDLVVRGSDNALWHKQFDVNTGWGGWESLGGTLTSGPSAVSWGRNYRLDVVARATDNTLTHWYWGPGGP